MFKRHTPEVAPTPAPAYDFLSSNHDYDNPDLIQNLRTTFENNYQALYAHYWNDPAIASEPHRVRRTLASDAARRETRNTTQTSVLAHINATASGALASVAAGPDRDDLLSRYNAQIWGWIDMPEDEWVGDKTDAGLPIGNGAYDRMAREVGRRSGVVVTPENTILRGKEAMMYSARTNMEQARSNYATMLSGKKTRSLRKAYAEQLGHRVSKAEALELAANEWRTYKLGFYDTVRQIRETELSGTDEEKRLAINTELIQEDIKEFHNLEVTKLAQMTDPKMGWLVKRLNNGNFAWRGLKNFGFGAGIFKVGALLAGATGGLLAPAVAAGLVGWRFYSRYATWQMRRESVDQASGADKQYYQAIMAQFNDHHKKTMSTQDIFARADSLSRTLEGERMDREKRNKLWSTGAVIGTILLPRILVETPVFNGVKDALGDSYYWLKDHSPWAGDDGGSGSGSTVLDTTPDGSVFDIDIPSLPSTSLTETIIPVMPGEGVLAHLKTGFGLNNNQAMNAYQALKANNYFDGSHILGIGTRNGEAINFLHGAGDGSYHFSSDAVKIIREAAGK